MLHYNTITIYTSTNSDIYVNFPRQILVSHVCHVFDWWCSLKRTILCSTIVVYDPSPYKISSVYIK